MMSRSLKSTLIIRTDLCYEQWQEQRNCDRASLTETQQNEYVQLNFYQELSSHKNNNDNNKHEQQAAVCYSFVWLFHLFRCCLLVKCVACPLCYVYKCLRYQQSTLTNVDCIDLVCGGRSDQANAINSNARCLINISFFTATLIVMTTTPPLYWKNYRQMCFYMNSYLLMNGLFFAKIANQHIRKCVQKRWFR